MVQMKSVTETQLLPFITADQIATRISELASEIRRDFGNEKILLVGILKGSFVFLADLARQLEGDVEIDFMQVSSYGMEHSSSGIVQFRKDLDINIEDQNVILVEDIVDSGLTLTYLQEVLRTRRPKALKVVALLSKPHSRKHEVLVDYVGFEIPDQFVVGYGLDDGERYRNLPYVAQLNLS